MTVFYDADWMGRRNLVASALGYRPEEPTTWDIAVVERLVALREREGEEAFRREVSALTVR